MRLTRFTCTLLPLLVFVTYDVTTYDVTTTVDVLADVTIFMQWTDVVLVYDSSLSQEEMVGLVNVLSEYHVSIVVLHVPSSRPDVIDSLTSIIHSTIVMSLILCLEPEVTDAFLKEASSSEAVPPHCQWLVVASQQVHVMQTSFSRPPCHVALLYDVRHDIINMTTPCHLESTTQTDISHLEPSHQSEEWRAASYIICSYNSQTAIFDYVASWTQSSKLTVFSDVIFPDFSRNFERRQLRLGIWQSLPFTIRISTNGTVKYKGFCMVLLEEMARVLNFTYMLVEPPDGLYGATEANGTWNGMVGMLVRGEVDMAVGPFSITPERKAVIDFTTPFMEDGGGILTKGGDPGPDLQNVFRPFPLLVWLLTGAAIVVTAVVLFVVNRVSDINWIQGYPAQQPWTMEDCLLAIYGSLMNQGASRHPVRGSGRVVLGCWWLFTILMVSVYTASLAALLTVRVHAYNVDSIQELAASSLDPITIAGSSWWTLFTKAHTGVYATVGERMRRAPEVFVNQEALDLVRKGTAAFILDVNQIRYLYGQDCHQLHMAHNIFNNNGLGFALPKNAIFREAINNIILKLQEGGFLEAWKRQWWQTTAQCDSERPTVSGATRLPLVSIGGILLLYGAVVLFSILCLFIQRLWYAARNSALWRRLALAKHRGGGSGNRDIGTES